MARFRRIMSRVNRRLTTYNVQFNPTLQPHEVRLNPLAAPADPAFPIVATTCRLTEHYLSGPMSRFNSWLNELQPEMFVEISPELAAERQIEHGGWMVVSTPRGEIEARAMVTRRLRSLQVQGRLLHHIGIPIHWGYAGEIVGDCANELTSLVTESNVSMHEAKAFACQVRAGRLHSRNQRGEVPFATLPVHEPVPDTPESAQPEGRQGTDRNGR
jgi:formate dehydrogenase major subunit